MKLKPTRAHTICEVCWFQQNPDRWPVSLRRDAGDFVVENCCYCGAVKMTRIYIQQDPKSPLLIWCCGDHPDEDD